MNVRLPVAALLLAALAAPAMLRAQAVHPLPAPTVHAARLRGRITLDGRLDDTAWARAEPAAGFRQHEPADGSPATQRTEVRFLYDRDALYIGARMYDALGAAGVRTRLARRDEDDGDDHFAIVLDTYHDHLGRLYLQVNPAGVRRDALGLGTSNPDFSWDGVWQAATRIDSLGWTAEIRIPFSTLRYPAGDVQIWGLQLWRYVQRLNETSQWSYWTRHDAGGPAFFGHLAGIEPPRRVVHAEVLPYTLVQWRNTERSSPLCASVACGPTTGVRAGADLRATIGGTAVTATLNPDFGQVELDPAVLNLTASESYFEEKRPFFLQEAGLFDFGATACFVCSTYVPVNLYYSRRIGHAPTLQPPSSLDPPSATRVLGAARVGSQTAGGWSFGAIEAVTAEAKATVLEASGDAVPMHVEPEANYATARVKRRLLDGDLTIGSAITSTDRRLSAAADSTLRRLLPATARAGGIDLDAWWGAHRYHGTVTAAVSSIRGDTAAIAGAQRSSVHYFQRPGRHARAGVFDDRYDPTRTSLDGYMTSARLAREAGAWAWEGGAELLSPGFEVNDLGFLTTAGVQWYGADLQRNFTRPTRAYQSLAATAGVELTRNFDGDVVSKEAHAMLSYVTPSFWTVEITGRALPAHYDDRLTRGGPTVRDPSGGSIDVRVISDPRDATGIDAWAHSSWDGHGGRDLHLAPTVTLRPASWMRLELTADGELATVADQYVTAVPDSTAGSFGGTRYVFARLARRTLALEARVGLTFSPRLSLDLYAQPFLASGAYDAYGEYAAPRRAARLTYGIDEGTITSEPAAPGEARELVVDPDGDGPAAPYRLTAPDFSRGSLRGNAVLRWEYRPGSTLYLAWTQTREDDGSMGNLVPGRDARALFATAPRNVVLLKASYRMAW
ncbi:MAG TPA: DUF5916 domain-containing protein [Gemmatimonadaceae bacterium]|nr:DUF5916 domain-containing protein [Gemmatimonadaceae bacterium]